MQKRVWTAQSETRYLVWAILHINMNAWENFIFISKNYENHMNYYTRWPLIYEKQAFFRNLIRILLY